MKKDTRLQRIKKLFLVFFRIGAFTFGGGYAMIPLIQKEIVDENHWIDEKDVVDIFAIVQSLPGVIAINSSTFVGYRVAGLPGALAATVGVVLPAFIVISVIAYFFYDFKDIPAVAAAFEGIRAGVVALITFAVQRLWKPSVKDNIGLVLAVASFLTVVATDINSIYILLVAAILGLILRPILAKKKAA